MTPLVQAVGLRKQYPGVTALDGVDFEISAGEIVGLVGKNGAGKSSLIRVMAGVEHTDSGELLVDGERMTEAYDPVQANRLGLAFVHQELSNVMDMSVAENIALGRPLPRRGPVIAWARLHQRVAEILDEIDARIDPRAIVRELSPAQQRIVMIARALFAQARMLVLDEPSASLTTEEIVQLHALVRRLAARGYAIVYVSHRLQEILTLTDRVVVMHDGRVSAHRPTSEFTAASLIDAILGEDASAPPAPTHRAEATARAETEQPLLRVRDLSGPPRVRDVSFDLFPGEILGLGGLVGAGRSELAYLLTGVTRRTSGSVELAGSAFAPRAAADALAAGMALIPEDRRGAGLVLDFDVRRNATLASLRAHVIAGTPFPSRRREERTADALIERLRIATAGHGQTVRTLSGGNQQKVVIGKYLMREPRVVIVDEPALGVDVHAKREIFLLLRELADAGAAVLMISSDFTELVEWCDRVLGFRDGTVSGELRGSGITERAITELAYGRAA